MDQAFDWAQQADWDQNEDLALYGITTALGVTEDAPPSLEVVVAGPGTAYGKDGERIRMSDTVVNMDMSVDEYGSATTVLAAPNERWISLFIRFARSATDPAVDGNSVTVYTKQQESYELFVRQASEQVIGTDTKPALMTDAILLCDVQLTNGQTTITNAGIDLTRREDYVRATGTTIADLVAGDPKTAIEWLYSTLDTFSVPGSLPFTFSSTWFGSVAVGSGVADVGAALNAIVSDLAAATGSAKVGTADVAGTYVSWSGASVAGALTATATAVNGHIGGGAPAHPAASVTFDDSSGTPTFLSQIGAAAAEVQTAFEAMIASQAANTTAADGTSRIGMYAIAGAKASIANTDLRSAIVDVYNELNSNVAYVALDENITGDWGFTGDPVFTENPTFSGVPTLTGANIGGGDSVRKGNHLAMNSFSLNDGTEGPGQIYGSLRTSNIGTTSSEPSDLCCVVDPDKEGNYLAVSNDRNTYNIYYCDPRDTTRTWTLKAMTGLDTSGSPTVTSMCSDGENVYLTIRRAAGTDSIAKVNFSSGAFVWEVPCTVANSFRGYPYDRIKIGPIITSSPWALNILVLCGDLTYGTTGLLEMRHSTNGALRYDCPTTGGAPWNTYKPTGALAHNGIMITTALETLTGSNPTWQTNSCTNGANLGQVTMGASSTSTHVARDILWDGMRFITCTESGSIRWHRPALTGYWDLETELGAGSHSMGGSFGAFALAFDGTNIWAPALVAGSRYINFMAKFKAADYDIAEPRVYEGIDVLRTWAFNPLTSATMGRGCQVGSYMAFGIMQPGGSPTSLPRSVVFIQNSSTW